MKLLLIILSIFCIQSCIQNQNSNVQSKIQNKLSLIDSNKNAIPQVQALLEGVWSNSIDSNENALFEINKGTILYLESPEKEYNYSIKNKTMTIFFDGFTVHKTIEKINSDSMILLRDGEFEVYFKRK